MAGLRVVVVGAGVMGATAALELARRGHGVTLVDPGPLPHPLAASTDVSKVVRIEYGSSEDYMKLGERALVGWHVWNRELGTELYHETGVLHLSLEPMAKGSFEQESWDLLRKRGHSPERIGAGSLAKRFPAFEGAPFEDGFFHARGGWVESGKVVSRIVELARKTGVELREGAAFERLALSGSRVTASS